VYTTRGLAITTLFKKLHTGDFEGAVPEIGIVTRRGTGGKVLPGLQRKRKDKQKLFVHGYND
jgi:GH24 family phage-related lysozyme (muramidase)